MNVPKNYSSCLELKKILLHYEFWNEGSKKYINERAVLTYLIQKTCKKVDVQLHAFLIFAADARKCSVTQLLLHPRGMISQQPPSPSYMVLRSQPWHREEQNYPSMSEIKPWPPRTWPSHATDWHTPAALLSLYTYTLSAALFAQYWMQKWLWIIKWQGCERTLYEPILKYSISHK